MCCNSWLIAARNRPPESRGRIRNNPDVFSIIPSSRSTQSKDKETLYPSSPSPFTTPASAATSWFALLIHPFSGRLFSFALVFSLLKSRACRSPCLKETKGKEGHWTECATSAAVDQTIHAASTLPTILAISPTIPPRLICSVVTRSLVAVAEPAPPPRSSDQVSRRSSMRITCKTNPVGTST